MTGKRVHVNSHIEALHQLTKAGGEFEMPKGLVNRLLEEAGKGNFEWPAKTTAQKLEDGLWEVVYNSQVDQQDFDAAVVLYELGVRAKGTHAA